MGNDNANEDDNDKMLHNMTTTTGSNHENKSSIDIDSANNNDIEQIGEVEYLSTTQLQITFSATFAGKAYLN